MLPDLGHGFEETIPLILNKHMRKCNKSAILLKRPSAIRFNLILKQLGKQSFLGKDKLLELFWGHKFAGYFSSKIVSRVSHLFEAGVFEWWQNFF